MIGGCKPPFLCYNLLVPIQQREQPMKDSNLEYAEWLTDQLLYNAVQSIEARLGSGYQIKNPRLISELVSVGYQEYVRQERLDASEN